MTFLATRPKLKRAIILCAVLFTLVGGVLWYVDLRQSFPYKFKRSKPALEAYATQVMASNSHLPIVQPPPRLGAFDTGKAERLPGGFLFFCDYGHWLDANGIAYSTVPLPRVDATGHDFFEHIEGNWYQFLRN